MMKPEPSGDRIKRRVFPVQRCVERAVVEGPLAALDE